MNNRLIGFLPAVLALAFGGCCTALNFREENDPKIHPSAMPCPKTVYGGVVGDAGFIAESFGTPFDSRDIANQILSRASLVGLCLVDMPLSLVADTATLPITVPATIDRAIMDYYL